MMKPSTKDETEGRFHEMKGAVKERAGKLANNSNLEAEGIDEQRAGKVQRKIGRVKKALETS